MSCSEMVELMIIMLQLCPLGGKKKGGLFGNIYIYIGIIPTRPDGPILNYFFLRPPVLLLRPPPSSYSKCSFSSVLASQVSPSSALLQVALFLRLPISVALRPPSILISNIQATTPGTSGHLYLDVWALEVEVGSRGRLPRRGPPCPAPDACRAYAHLRFIVVSAASQRRSPTTPKNVSDDDGGQRAHVTT